MAQMVGAMVLARAVDDRTLAKEIPRCGDFRSNASGALILGNRWVST